MMVRLSRVCYNCFHSIPDQETCPLCGYNPTHNSEKYPFALKEGAVLANRYVVGRVLGQGGFGITYVAFDYQTRSRVAIKEYMPAEIAGRSPNSTYIQVYSAEFQNEFDQGKNQFLAEAKTLAEFVGNEHIVGILSYFEENRTAYYTMEYMEGLTLKQLLMQKQRPLTVAETNWILLPVMEALDWVHSKGIIHRDISPDNIMLRKDGTAKLIDFGSARTSAGEKSKSFDVILKHGFAPMEQYTRRGRQGPYTDVYAMAATYYYAVTGKVPEDAIERSDNDELIMPSSLGISIDENTETTLKKALAVYSVDRYQTMADFYQDMLATAKGQKIRVGVPGDLTASETSNNKRNIRSNKTLWALASCIGIAAILSFVFWGNSFSRRITTDSIPEETAAPAVSESNTVTEPGYTEDNLDSNEQAQFETDSAYELEEQTTEGKSKSTETGNRPDVTVVTEPSTSSDLQNQNENGNVSVQTETDNLTDSKGTEESVNTETDANETAATKLEESEQHEIPIEAEESLLQAKNGIELLKGSYNESGSIVRFGHYEQDGDEENGQEPIEWIILDAEENRRLLISRYVVDTQPFNIGGDPASVTWETSTLRNWLNDEFLELAFDLEDRNAIVKTLVANNRKTTHNDFHILDWNDTEDQIFLLSYAEAWKYFRIDFERRCLASNYSVSTGSYVNKDNRSCPWWLRSQGEQKGFISYVYMDGSLATTDVNNISIGTGVRPALWIDLNILNVNPDEVAIPDKPEYGAVGTIVTYGNYEQDNDLENGKEPIEWIVLDEDGDRRLLLSRYGLDRQRFHQFTDLVFWETSWLRSWLNSQFFKEAFTPEEQKMILDTVVDNNKNQWYHDTYTGNKSLDKLFLLSYVELEHYMPEQESRICENTPYAIAQKVSRTEKWWLRSPGRVLQFADYIDSAGKRGDETMTNGENFVRPAMWIEISSLKGEPAKGRDYDVKQFATVGNVVKFGQYEQDNDLDNGKEDIEWIVLSVSGNECFLISRCGLDKKQFNNQNKELLWSEASLRNWLNEDFYGEAFDSAEKEAIQTTRVNNSSSQWYYDVRSGTDTEDKLFLLSFAETWDFFQTDYERTCAATPYANSGLNEQLHEWWLRSPGKVYHYADIVDVEGKHFDDWVCEKNYLVRPVMIVDLNASVFQDE